MRLYSIFSKSHYIKMSNLIRLNKDYILYTSKNLSISNYIFNIIIFIYLQDAIFLLQNNKQENKYLYYDK
jgi:hypothetical protein